MPLISENDFDTVPIAPPQIFSSDHCCFDVEDQHSTTFICRDDTFTDRLVFFGFPYNPYTWQMNSKCGRSSVSTTQQSSTALFFCHYKSVPLTDQLSVVFARRASVPRDLIRHVNEWVCVEKQWKIGGNGLCVHLVWPLCSLIDQLWNNKQKFLNKVPISCCAIS